MRKMSGIVEIVQEILTLFGIMGIVIILISLFLGNIPRNSAKRKIWLLVLASPAISYLVITPLISLLYTMDIPSFIAFGFLITVLLMAYLAVIGKSV
jgi:antibiotic biosynthesis monooxygenase (ABM) superfamily enzyme